MNRNLMHTSKQTELVREAITPQSLGRQRFGRWLRVATAALALIVLMVPPAEAGVEFVTRTTDCNRLDRVGDGKDLFIIAGQNVRFRVFGNAVDLTNRNNGFRIAVDSGDGDVSARIVSQGHDCEGMGFALVEVDSPLELTSNIQRSLFFKMPLGDESRLQVTIKAYPTINVSWFSESVGCIVKTGTLEKLLQDHKIRITLPAGHSQDETTCNQRTLFARVSPSNIGELDIRGPDFRYSVTGHPTFMTSNQANAVGPTVGQGTAQLLIPFLIDVAGIRDLTTTSNSTITVRSRNPNRTSTLTLEVVPNLSNGFTQAASCRNLTTGELVNVNDQVHCELRLAFPPPPAGQKISYEVRDRLCVAGAGYSDATGKGSVTLNGSGNIFDVQLLTARGGASSVGTPCSSDTGVQVTVNFWIGEQDTSTPDTLDSFRIRRP
ncbi:MAG TPA: hypothetical protein VEW46_10110 [Pyrinomonadaceae bacterium]|nr:hypothetical protein [Pyrinomonadaceae bacterium]